VAPEFYQMDTSIFIPIAIKTLGVWGPGATELVNALGRRLLEASPGRITGQNVCQWLRIDIAVQRGNAPSMRGTFPAAASAGVVFYAVECG